MALSDFGNEFLVTSANGVTFDLNKDYSKAIADARASGQDTSLLEAQRQAKINSSAYGGNYKTGDVSSSLGNTYNENVTIANRTSNADPISLNYNNIEETQTQAATNTDLSEYLREMYAQNTAAELAALKSTYEQNTADLQANAAKIPETYQAARNETAAQSELAKRDTAEMFNAYGLNTGTTGQAELARQVALSGNLANIAGQESNALADNALEQNKLAIAYRNAIDEATASGNAALAQSLYSEYVRQLEYAAAADAAAQEQANWEKQFAYTQQATDREYAYNLATAALQAGIMPDSATLSAAGISTTDANNLASYYKLLGTTSGSSGSGGSGGNGSIGSVSASGGKWDDVVAWVGKYGDDSAENYIAEHYKDLGYSSNSAALAGWENYLLENSYETEVGSVAGMNESYFNQLGKTINQYLSQGMQDTAFNYIANVADTLSPSQLEGINALFQRYGYAIM